MRNRFNEQLLGTQGDAMQNNNKSPQGIGRRLFLKAAGAMGIVLGLPALAWTFVKERFPIRTVEISNFRFDPDTGLVHWSSGKSEPYRLVVDGLVDEPVALTYQELRALPQVEQVSDFHCVEGWSMYDVRWGGFRFDEILKRVKPKPEADHVVFHSIGETKHKPQGQDHYIESFPLKKLLRPDTEILMVLDQDGKPLFQPHGAPLRVISPYDQAYKSIKFVSRIELASRSQPGWWTMANPIYPVVAPVERERLRRKKGN